MRCLTADVADRMDRQVTVHDVLMQIAHLPHGVIDRYWRVPEMDVILINGTGGYEEYAVEAMFPELAGTDFRKIQVSGERLMERCALLINVESALLLRLLDPAAPVDLDPDYRVGHRPDHLQATNCDLEIRVDNDDIHVVGDEITIENLRSQGFLKESS